VTTPDTSSPRHADAPRPHLPPRRRDAATHGQHRHADHRRGRRREAGVSRSWNYSQPDLHAEIARLRDRARPVTQLVADRQRASDASLLRRVELAARRIRELETENKRLRQALAEALGPPHHDTPK
jgi:uncharacterized protein DUF6262